MSKPNLIDKLTDFYFLIDKNHKKWHFILMLILIFPPLILIKINSTLALASAILWFTVIYIKPILFLLILIVKLANYFKSNSIVLKQSGLFLFYFFIYKFFIISIIFLITKTLIKNVLNLMNTPIHLLLFSISYLIIFTFLYFVLIYGFLLSAKEAYILNNIKISNSFIQRYYYIKSTIISAILIGFQDTIVDTFKDFFIIQPSLSRIIILSALYLIIAIVVLDSLIFKLVDFKEDFQQ